MGAHVRSQGAGWPEAARRRTGQGVRPLLNGRCWVGLGSAHLRHSVATCLLSSHLLPVGLVLVWAEGASGPEGGGHSSLHPGAGPKSLELRDYLGPRALGRTSPRVCVPQKDRFHELPWVWEATLRDPGLPTLPMSESHRHRAGCSTAAEVSLVPSPLTALPGSLCWGCVCPSLGRQWVRVQRAWVWSQLFPWSPSTCGLSCLT